METKIKRYEQLSALKEKISGIKMVSKEGKACKASTEELLTTFLCEYKKASLDEFDARDIVRPLMYVLRERTDTLFEEANGNSKLMIDMHLLSTPITEYKMLFLSEDATFGNRMILNGTDEEADVYAKMVEFRKEQGAKNDSTQTSRRIIDMFQEWVGEQPEIVKAVEWDAMTIQQQNILLLDKLAEQYEKNDYLEGDNATYKSEAEWAAEFTRTFLEKYSAETLTDDDAAELVNLFLRVIRKRLDPIAFIHTDVIITKLDAVRNRTLWGYDLNELQPAKKTTREEFEKQLAENPFVSDVGAHLNTIKKFEEWVGKQQEISRALMANNPDCKNHM